MIAPLILAIRLQVAVLTLWGAGGTHAEADNRTVRPADAARASLIIAYTHGAWEPELVAVIAVRESSMRRHLVNARSGACGPGQILVSHDAAVQARACRGLLRDEWRSYHAIKRKLDQAQAYCRTRDPSVTCALAGYRSGPPGVDGRWYRRPRFMILRSRQLASVCGRACGVTRPRPSSGGAARVISTEYRADPRLQLQRGMHTQITNAEFSAAVDPVLPKLRRQLYGFVRADDVDDVMQATLLRALDAWQRAAAGDPAVRVPRDGVGVKAWLYTIARNEYALAYRRSQRRRFLASDEEIAAAMHPTLDAEQSGHRLPGQGNPDDALTAAMESLPQEHRDVLMHRAEGESYLEIASALGLPIGTVMSRLNRARTKIQSILSAPVPA